MEKLLIVEDDAGFSDQLSSALKSHGWTAEIALNGSDGLQLLHHFRFDFILLDWELPDISGLEICRTFRARGGNTPIIFLTGRREIEDKEAGFAAGGDDYLTKPFDVRELIARIGSIKRRPRMTARTPLVINNLALDPRLRVVRSHKGEVQLSFRESNILEFFLSNRNVFFSGAQIFEALWPTDTEASDQTVKVHMGLLRKKLAQLEADSLISTVKGAGYILRDDSADE